LVFDQHIGIDYSGADTAVSRLPGLQVYRSAGGGLPERVDTPARPENRRWNWNRTELAAWLTELALSGERFIAGLDHGLSVPWSYFQRYELLSWDQFLDDFVQHWPLHRPHLFVDVLRDRGCARTGKSTEYRITERWTSSAKSVFHFDAQGQVAKSTHAGIPWLHQLRQRAGQHLHFWPFDGWDLPEDKAVLCEVFPSILRRRYPAQRRSSHEHDAYAVARWLRDLDARGGLDHYAHPRLTDAERNIARLEGWIFGIA
jgi:hypothetical protein